MSFGVSTIDRQFEWASSSFWGFVGRFSNLFKPWFWRLVFDIVRFTYFASDILIEKPTERQFQHLNNLQNDTLKNRVSEEGLESIGAYLRRHRYSRQFMTAFLIPMVAAPWCIDLDEFSRTFPAKPLIEFM
jgi:predicted NAD/FAD-binding protein